LSYAACSQTACLFLLEPGNGLLQRLAGLSASASLSAFCWSPQLLKFLLRQLSHNTRVLLYLVKCQLGNTHSLYNTHIVLQRQITASTFVVNSVISLVHFYHATACSATHGIAVTILSLRENFQWHSCRAVNQL